MFYVYFQVTNRLNQLIKRENKEPILQCPLINTALSFTNDHTKAVEDVQKGMSQLGRTDSSNTIPLLCYATKQDLRGLNLINNLQKKLKVHAVSFDGDIHENEEGGEIFTATLVSPGDQRAECRVEDHNDGTYTICYTPKISGRHSLHVHLHGQPISGSPFHIKSQPMKYQPVNIKQQKSRVTWDDPPIVGVPHCISIDVESDLEDGEPEAKVNAITADISTDEKAQVPCTVTRTEDATRVTFTPPKAGKLHVSIKINDQPIVEPFELEVTSLMNSLISWQQQQPPVVGQRWLLTVDLRNDANENMRLNPTSVAIVMTNKSGNSETPGTARSITNTVDSKHEFECVCSSPGNQNVSLQVKGVNTSQAILKAIDRLQFTMSENKSSFPTSVDSSLSGKIYISDTKLGYIYVRNSEKSSLTNHRCGYWKCLVTTYQR